jgi:hypothetical protein
MMFDDLDIPDFLRRDRHSFEAAPIAAVKKPRRERPKQHPPGWHSLTKAEQDGTADAATLKLRKQLGRDTEAKRAARFAALRELAAERKARKEKVK